jgi:hypothetical protein
VTKGHTDFTGPCIADEDLLQSRQVVSRSIPLCAMIFHVNNMRAVNVRVHWLPFDEPLPFPEHLPRLVDRMKGLAVGEHRCRLIIVDNTPGIARDLHRTEGFPGEHDDAVLVGDYVNDFVAGEIVNYDRMDVCLILQRGADDGGDTCGARIDKGDRAL